MDPAVIAREKRALTTSAVGALIIGCAGVTFAMFAGSRAIALDGIFNIVYFVTGLVTLKVAKLVLRGDDDEFPAGYSFFEPLVNGLKGVLVLGVSLMAFFEAIGSVLDGGRMIDLGPAMGYGAFAVVACSALGIVMHRGAKSTGSPLVEADAKNWIVNGAISFAVLAAFVLVYLLKETTLRPIVPYVDPGLVILVVAISISVPVRMSWGALLALLNRTPSQEILATARDVVKQELAHLPLRHLYVRVIQPGRVRSVMAHVVLPEDHPVTLAELDAIRQSIHESLEKHHQPLISDIVFTANPEWGKLADRNASNGRE